MTLELVHIVVRFTGLSGRVAVETLGAARIRGSSSYNAAAVFREVLGWGGG